MPANSASPNTAKSVPALPNVVFWASVTLSTSAALAASNAANFSFNLLTAVATSSGFGFSWFNIFCASAWAFLASSFAES